MSRPGSTFATVGLDLQKVIELESQLVHDTESATS